MRAVRGFWIIALALTLCATARQAAVAQQVVYGDTLVNSWQDWSWDPISRNLANTSPVQSGTASTAVTYTGGWSGLQFGRVSLLDVSAYDTFRFYIHGGTAGGQTVEVQVGNNGNGVSVTQQVTPTAGAWTQVDISLFGLGTSRQVNYIHWFNATPGTQPVFYIDNVSFLASGAPTPTPVPPGAGPALSVDANAARHTISPHIYGLNFPDETLAAELDLPVARWGGNSTTRYNYLNDTSNRASDWYFENIPNDNANPAALPNGSSSDQFIDQNLRTGSDTLLTVPLIGWTPKTRAYACGFSVALYGAQQSTDPWRPDCGNGVRSNGSLITGNAATDTSLAITPSFVQGWMNHLIGRYGNAAAGGVQFYNLDNEPMLWNSTHRDVHPAALGYDELRDRTVAYAAAIKATDPTAKTLGPAEWGWSGYFWSALDAAPGGAWWNNPLDRLAHGNTPLVEWYLQQLRAYEQQNGVRLLDYLDLHYYPQASGVSLSGAGNSTTQALRLRTTRSLWDPSYTDESWIGEAVQLIPRMRQWVNINYPGTKLAIGEYNWGALDHINGALAQADVLGIFGREGLDLATLWDPPTATEPGAFSFRVYRNYDGNAGRFGDVGVSATSGNQEQLSIYASQRSADSALTLMIINKSAQPLTSAVSLSNFNAATAAQVYRYSSANLAAIVRETDQAVGPTGFTATFPAASITLVVLAPSSVAPASPTRTATASATRTPSSTLPPSPTQTPTRTLVPSSSPTRSPTSTPTPTMTQPPPSPTQTATLPPGSFGLSGGVHYLGSALPVSGIGMRVSGPGSTVATTDSNGQFTLSGLAADNWTLSADPLSAASSAITSIDAVWALQAGVGMRTLTPLQRLACDSNGSGSLTAIDASMILQYRVGLITQLPSSAQCGSGWLFAPVNPSGGNIQTITPQLSGGVCTPGSIRYQPLTGSQTAQDLTAVALGDCNLSWQPSGGGGNVSVGGARLVTLRQAGRRVRYAILGTNIGALEAKLSFDASELTLRRARRGGPDAMLAVNAAGPGELRLALASLTPVSDGNLVVLDFERKHGRARTPRLVSATTWGAANP